MADLEQQQEPTGVMPPAGESYAVGGPSTTGGGEFYSPWAWIKTPKGILRLVEWLFAIISFGCMADAGDGWDDFSQFKFLVAVGVLVFIYTTVLIFVYIFRRTIEQRFLYLPPIELALDGIFCVLLLAAGAAAAAKMNKDIDIGGGREIKLLDAVSSRTKRNLQASAVFTFFNLFCMIGSTFLSYRENAAEERKR